MTTTQPFKVQAGIEAGVHAFTIFGELDQATAGQLQEPLMEAIDEGARAVLIDLADCEFIDSTGLSVLVQAHRRLVDENQQPGRFTICCPDPQVHRLLEITGLDRAMGVYEDRAEALAMLRA